MCNEYTCHTNISKENNKINYNNLRTRNKKIEYKQGTNND